MRIDYLGFIIKRECPVWVVYDWDWEGNYLVHVASTQYRAMAWVEQRCL